MKNYDLKDFLRIFEENKTLPHKSHRKFIGFFLNLIRKVFSPFFEFFLGAKIETQRKANLLILKEIEEIKKGLETLKIDFENFKKATEDFKEQNTKNFLELQKELLNLRDEKIPALKEGIGLGLEGIDKKAEWAISNLVSIRTILEKGVELKEEEKKLLKETITSLNFLQKFRGDEGEIKKRQEIYLNHIKNSQFVIDLGCGRGEFLEILQKNSIQGAGVEKEPSLCAILKEKNLRYFQRDIFDFLEEKPLDFDTVVSFHLIEHLSLKEAIYFLKLIYDKLPNKGILIIETPNPTSLFSFLNFFKDPGHKTPWHPETLNFYANEIGFVLKEKVYLEEVKFKDSLDIPAEIKSLIYGPQDYGMVFEKP